MRLILLDNNLDHKHGHHGLYDRVIGGEAVRRGMEALVIGHRRFGEDRIGDLTVHPLLETTSYRAFSKDPVFAAYDDVEMGNRAIFSELMALPRDFFGRGDACLVHTCSHITVMGLVTWIDALPAARRPDLTIFLMLPSGVGFDGEGALDMVDPPIALAYREAFRRAKASEAAITFLATGHQHAREFSALAGWEISSHPLLSAFDECRSEAAVIPEQVLLFAGDAKMNKGLGLLPEVIERVCPAFPGHRFVIHANPGAAWGEALKVIARLQALAGEHANLDLRLASLDAQAYADLLTASAVVLLPYDPAEYRRKSSGVVWEAIASASALVVPEATWLAAECAHWEAGFATFRGNDGASAAEALTGLLQGPSLRPRAEAAARRFAAANGVKALVDVLADRWAGLAVAPAERAQARRIGAAEFRGKGWHDAETVDGAAVRWSAKAAEVAAVLPGLGLWTLRLTGLRCQDEAQLQSARLTVDGREVPVRHALGRDGAWSLTCTWREARADLPVRVLGLRLGWTRSGGDPRELGLLATGLEIEESVEDRSRVAVLVEPVSDDEAAGADGWTAPLTAGRWSIETRGGMDGVVGLLLDDPAEDHAAGLRAFCNGQPLEARRMRTEKGWLIQPMLPRALVRAGAKAEIQLVLAAPARVLMQQAVWQSGAALPEAPVQRTETARPVAPPRPVLAAAPRRRTGARWSCSQVQDVGSATFANLRVTGAVFGNRVLSDFHIKLFRSDTFFAVELRERDGAFQLLRDPDPAHVHKDDWGAAITLFTDPEGRCTGARPGDIAADVSALLAILDEMPEGVATCDLPKAESWRGAAATLAGLAQVADAAE
ncbi:MAG: hypothetical protein KDK24_15035 [Pseudooceanicola sp.]|nr:hypothetical protein [Pseudooceanicola sp.]